MAIANKETFDIINKRRDEFLEKINHPDKNDTHMDILALKIRWNELGRLLDLLDYEEPDISLEELFSEWNE